MARLPISRAALSSRLGMMAEAGLMRRDPPEAKRAQYVLTDAGQALKPTFDAMKNWSGRHLFEGNETPDW